MTPGDFALTAVVGIVSGVLAAALWLAIIYQIRPKIAVAPKIRQAPGDKSCQIKVVNRRRRPAVNVKAQLTLYHSTKAGSDEFNTGRAIPLRKSTLLQLSGVDRTDRGAAVFRFATNEDLKLLLEQNPGAWLAFRMMATHPVTNFGDVFGANYRDATNDIVLGNFDREDSFKINPLSPPAERGA